MRLGPLELTSHYSNQPVFKRAGNSDRDKYVDHLSNCVATGHLKQSEFEERRDLALEAATHDELNALVRDLPGFPEPRRVKVTKRMAGGNFSLWQWLAGVITGMAMAILPAPLMANAFHGADNGPLHGNLAILIIFLGVISTLVWGVVMAPDGEEYRTVT